MAGMVSPGLLRVALRVSGVVADRARPARLLASYVQLRPAGRRIACDLCPARLAGRPGLPRPSRIPREAKGRKP